MKILLFSFNTAAQSLGVCYGRVANNLPPAQEVIDLYKANGFGRMRIYNPDQATIQALKGSNIELVVGVPNEDIQSLANVASAAAEWVENNIQKYSQDVKIRYIVVGNEIKPNYEQAQYVLPAMQNIYDALAHASLHSQIKVSTAIDMSLLGSSYPPSLGAFSPSSISYTKPIVSFLEDKGAPLLANLYTYFSYIGDMTNINLDYALFTSPTIVVKDGEKGYQNLFDASLGALYAALEKIGASNLEVVVSESGWPSDGGVAASVDNARTYYQNLINHVARGTPNRPNQVLETYLFAMFDENQKGPAETERHFGLFTPNKQPKYHISFTRGTKSASSSAHLTRKGIFPFLLVLSIFIIFLA